MASGRLDIGIHALGESWDLLRAIAHGARRDIPWEDLVTPPGDSVVPHARPDWPEVHLRCVGSAVAGEEAANRIWSQASGLIVSANTIREACGAVTRTPRFHRLSWIRRMPDILKRGALVFVYDLDHVLRGAREADPFEYRSCLGLDECPVFFLSTVSGHGIEEMFRHVVERAMAGGDEHD